MDTREKFREQRKIKGYYGYLYDQYEEMINNNEREEYNEDIMGVPGKPKFEFVDAHDFTSFLEYHAETKKRKLADYRKFAYSCLQCRVCNNITCFRQTSAKYGLVCPSGDRFRYDNYFGHGKNQMARALLEGELSLQVPPAEPLKPIFEPTESFLHAIYTCTLCGGCEAQCKIQKLLEPMHITVAMREWLVEQGLGPLPEHLRLFKHMENYDNPWGAPRASRNRWIPKGFNVKDLSKKGKDTAEVLYYVGCTEAMVGEMQKVAATSASNMKAAGVDYGVLGMDEVCCGSTMLRIGDRKGFDKFKDRNLDIFDRLISERGVKKIVTACAGCYSVLKEEYSEYLDCEIYHIVEFLDQLISEGKLKPKKKVQMNVTYHDPCHLARYCGVYDAPRNILKAIPGVKLVEMERIKEDAYCCGAGGGAKTAFPEFAIGAARKRLEEAKETTGCDTVVSACPFCEQNLGDASKSVGMNVIDVNELLAKSL